MQNTFSFRSHVTMNGTLTSHDPEQNEIHEEGEIHSIHVVDVKINEREGLVKTPCAIMVVDKGNSVVMRTVPITCLVYERGSYQVQSF